MAKEKKLALVICYFGPLPAYADLFFKSVKENPTTDFILATDQLVKNPPANLKVKYLTLADLRAKFQKKLGFQIRLHAPYKICDYRYWGHCDLDQVMGDLEKFLPEKLLEKYDKVYQHGHLTVFRNTLTNNLRFVAKGGLNYRQVFQTDLPCVFDEVEGIQKKFARLGAKCCLKRDFADIYSWREQMRRTKSYLRGREKKKLNSARQVFFYEKGRVYRAYFAGGKMNYEELAYLHFPKRQMRQNFYQSNSYFIGKDGFYAKEPGFNVTMGEIKRYNGFSLLGEARVKLAYWTFIWTRRYRKYVLKR
ncbi:DUF6625 family protein [Lactobacillus delbrueckii]|uniref:DUF6625 family protein n=1 Tax=Lactobacillus delbrueckii TaxID=1584 RepID=UPI0022E274C6|nr:DUF6625 family protein [Lactobacillus delbrueckii]